MGAGNKSDGEAWRLSPFALFYIAAVVQISFMTVATELKAPVSLQVQSPNLCVPAIAKISVSQFTATISQGLERR